ncbi:hypothetical protein BpHYR1_014835 [Brachionus plicatilis]|uniref:Uncharacterized protein n=1 Tax=Brachionus plicatilis TaxID=10195 RepID=A0A3M7QIL5_BRAPC|nr:hypothetical protein BpHYR1_014835 [Brachionus plicatilis]
MSFPFVELKTVKIVLSSKKRQRRILNVYRLDSLFHQLSLYILAKSCHEFIFVMHQIENT